MNTIRNDQEYPITIAIPYQEARRRLIAVKKTIHEHYTETKQFFGEREAFRIRYQLTQMFNLVKLRQDAHFARYWRGTK